MRGGGGGRGGGELPSQPPQLWLPAPSPRNTQLPVAEPTEELPVATALRNKHEVARGDVGLVQGHEPLVVQGSEHLILLQHPVLALGRVRHDLGNERPACGVLPAGSHNTKAAPVCVGGGRDVTDSGWALSL